MARRRQLANKPEELYKEETSEWARHIRSQDRPEVSNLMKQVDAIIDKGPEWADYFEATVKASAEPEKVSYKEGNCPKCGKYLKKGMYMHVKWCKG